MLEFQLAKLFLRGIVRKIWILRTVVAQERDDEVVAQREQVHGVAEEIGHPVVACDQRHEEELQNVEEDPERQECADRDLCVLVSLAR